MAIERFDDYKNHIKGIVENDFQTEQNELEKDLRNLVTKVNAFKTSSFDEPNFYPGTGSHKYGQNKGKMNQIQLGATGASGNSGMGTANGTGMQMNLSAAVGSIPGSVIPAGFTHYTYCSCYVPDGKKPHPTMKYAEMEMMSEQ